MRKAYSILRNVLKVVMMQVVPVLMLTSCMAGINERPRFASDPQDYVSFQTVKTTLLFSPSDDEGRYVSSSGKDLKFEIAKLAQEKPYQVRLRAKTSDQQKKLEVRIEALFKRAGKAVPLTSGPVLTSDSPFAISLEVYRQVLQISDCHKGGSFVRPGCVIAVNRALSLKYPHELRQGRDLSPPFGVYDAKVMENLRTGKHPDLPALSKSGGGDGSD